MPDPLKDCSPATRELVERILNERDRLYTERVTALEKLFNERHRLYAARFTSLENTIREGLSNLKESVTVAFAASEKAVDKAEQAQKEYNFRSNEFRGQLDDQAKTLMPRTESMAMHKSMEEKVNVMQLATEGKITNIQQIAKSELEAAKSSFEKAITQIDQQIVTLREFRSGIGGRDTAYRSVQEQHNWAVGITVAIALSILDSVITIVTLLHK
jgi:chromosome segregation ATPase